jgi:mRNA interferase MazF
MAFKRGGIYLANFKPSKGSEEGTGRPCMILQSDLLNQAGHPGTTILPLTTHLIDDAAPLRVRINAREELRSDSDVMIDQVRTLDNRRFCSDLLTTVSDAEMAKIETCLQIVLDFRI